MVAIIVLLATLLLAGVESGREAARRTGCLDHLRQMGLALLNYHEALASFPPGAVNYRPPNSHAGERHFAWSALILPLIEQRDLYEQVNFDRAFDDPANSTAANQVIGTYLCPQSLGRGKSITKKSKAGYLISRRDRGPIDYGGIFGERITGPNVPPKGTMLYDRAVRIADITDGTTATLIVGEESRFPDGEWINANNVFDQSPFPMNQAPAIEQDLCSEHKGGAQALFAGGNARFLSENIAPRVLAAICTRASGELIDDF